MLNEPSKVRCSLTCKLSPLFRDVIHVRSSPRLSRFSILQVTKSWGKYEDEATLLILRKDTLLMGSLNLVDWTGILEWNTGILDYWNGKKT